MARALFVFGLLFATAALACPVCGTPTDQNQGAYIAMTVFMSLTPLAFIGGVVFWVFWRVRKSEAGEVVVAPPSPPSGACPELVEGVTNVQEQNASA